MVRSATFSIIEPYADGPRRFHQATVTSGHARADVAFAELERMTERLRRFNMSVDQFDWIVVVAGRRPVRGH
jgi:hypothetical protein